MDKVAFYQRGIDDGLKKKKKALEKQYSHFKGKGSGNMWIVREWLGKGHKAQVFGGKDSSIWFGRHPSGLRMSAFLLLACSSAAGWTPLLFCASFHKKVACDLKSCSVDITDI